VAIGHPFGATGTRYVLTLATALRERNARYGSGHGDAVVLENPNAGSRRGSATTLGLLGSTVKQTSTAVYLDGQDRRIVTV
jgi:acetyl-CoA acetyltransferase